MSKKLLPEDTVIIWNANPIGEYRNFLYATIGRDFIDGMDYSGFQKWLFSHAGKTLKEVVTEHNSNYKAESMEELLTEKRFSIISKPDKKFMIAFDKAMNELGYDSENIIGSFTVVYGKTSTKSRPCPARIYIKDDGAIVLRLYLNKVDKHREFIENAPKHIKDAFRFKGGDCKSCNTMCAPGKTYTIDGKTMHKCNHSVFYFAEPSLEKLPDIMALLAKFYPVKKLKS